MSHQSVNFQLILYRKNLKKERHEETWDYMERNAVKEILRKW